MRRLLVPALAAALGAAGLASPARAGYLEELVARARTERLAEARPWRVLLHYRPDLLTAGVTSLADSPGFFLAPGGKLDPQAELEATLASFFAEPAHGRPHPQCALPARYRWLDAVLRFDPARLPPRPCPELDAWLRDIGAVAVTLVFAESFMNNPASMFGHTLLRVDAVPPDTDVGRRDLLAYAVNFAADSGSDRGALYAVKGLTGAYPGFFSLEPYYDKVKRYGDWESRDLWEYRLALAPDEVERLLLHLWELRDIAFDYYFFDENCSYELLGLLEAARPDLALRDRFRVWVIPIDTVRAVVQAAGLASAVVYRPSAATRLRHLAGELSGSERRLAHEIAEGRVDLGDPLLAALPDAARARVLLLAHDHLRLQAERDETPERRARALRLLAARARIPLVGDPAAPPAAPATAPDEGHGAARLLLATGVRDDEVYVEVRARPSFHDLLDPQGGFTEGAQIELMDVALRYYPEREAVELHELTLVDIVSLAPRDGFFRPVSWRLRTGLESALLPRRGSGGLSDGKLWRTGGGAGLAARPWPGALAYAFAEGSLDFGGRLHRDFALGAGASAGLLLGDEDDLWRAHLRVAVARYVAGDARTAWSAGVDQRLRLTRNTALELSAGAEHDFGRTWLDAGLSWNVYF
jgi:hypothetical protein